MRHYLLCLAVKKKSLENKTDFNQKLKEVTHILANKDSRHTQEIFKKSQTT